MAVTGLWTKFRRKRNFVQVSMVTAPDCQCTTHYIFRIVYRNLRLYLELWRGLEKLSLFSNRAIIQPIIPDIQNLLTQVAS